MNIFRHGDIPITPTKKIEGELVNHNGSIVLAEGETTGHRHVITVPKIDDMVAYKTADGGYVLVLKEDGVVTHEEHKTLIVKKGTYRVGKEREVDHFAGSVTRKVVD